MGEDCPMLKHSPNFALTLDQARRPERAGRRALERHMESSAREPPHDAELMSEAMIPPIDAGSALTGPNTIDVSVT